MSDNDAKKTPAETPEVTAETRQAAKVGVEDRGHIVGTAADQPVDGMIADLADGGSISFPRHGPTCSGHPWSPSMVVAPGPIRP